MRKNSECPDEGEKQYYFLDPSSKAELENFFPNISSLSPEELADEDNVPKKYPVTNSRILAAVEDDEIRDFKEANYREIRRAGLFVDEVLHDIDNDHDLVEKDIRNRLGEAFANIYQVKRRVKDFDPDSTSIIYTDEAKEEFLEYIEYLEGKVQAVGEETSINVQKEFEYREKELFDPYTALEPNLNEYDTDIDEEDHDPKGSDENIPVLRDKVGTALMPETASKSSEVNVTAD